MSEIRGEILEWVGSGRVVPSGEFAVLRAGGIIPTPAQWRAFLGQLTLWLGTLALAAAVIFFFAFNWDDLGRLAKIGLAEAAVVAALLACWSFDLDGVAGKAALTLASLLVGALLALVGQAYQTGADTYELFAYWAALILPWVLVGRFVPLWLIWLGLLDIAVVLYFPSSRDAGALWWTLFALNGLALAVWEVAYRIGLSWLRERWPPRLLAIVSAAAATALVIWAIFDGHDLLAALAALAYLAWLAAMYRWYRTVRPDLLILALGLLSLIVATAAFLSHHMLASADGAAFLFIGLVVIGMSAAGGAWLKSVGREHLA